MRPIRGGVSNCRQMFHLSAIRSWRSLHTRGFLNAGSNHSDSHTLPQTNGTPCSRAYRCWRIRSVCEWRDDPPERLERKYPNRGRDWFEHP